MIPHPQRAKCIHKCVCFRHNGEGACKEWGTDAGCIQDCNQYIIATPTPTIERDKMLNRIIDLVDGRIAGLDNLLATSSEQRIESAQDKYLKEARFELGLVQNEYKEHRTTPAPVQP